MCEQEVKALMNDLDLPLQLTLAKASEISGINIWSLRKMEKKGEIPKGRRIGSRVYLNTRNFLHWLLLEGGENYE